MKFDIKCIKTSILKVNVGFDQYVKEMMWFHYQPRKKVLTIQKLMCHGGGGGGQKLGGSKSTAGLHSQCSPATLM